MICLYGICKNEEKNVEMFVEQGKHFDKIVVLDTGSTDNTVEMLREKGVEVHERTYEEFDFSRARNDALYFLPEECKWAFTLDFNEDLSITEDQINYLRRVDKFDGFKVNCFDANIETYQERKLKIHKPLKYMWKYAVHEYLYPIEDDLKLGHLDIRVTKRELKTPEKLEFYTSIAEREHQRDPSNPHYAWWAVTVYREQPYFDPEKLMYYAGKYLENTEAYKFNFRVYAFVYISSLVTDRTIAIDHGIHAVSEAIKFRETDPNCFQFAINNLTRLGVSIQVGDQIQNGE